MMRKKLTMMLLEERGATIITTLFFLMILCGLFTLYLFSVQVDIWEMKVQHTADLISKGARSAGKWEYVDESGKVRKRLFATEEEASRYQADVVRGAREEAEILYRLNLQGVLESAQEIEIIHQKGEQNYLYNQGIYHVAIEVSNRITLLLESFGVTLRRVSQSEV